MVRRAIVLYSELQKLLEGGGQLTSVRVNEGKEDRTILMEV